MKIEFDTKDLSEHELYSVMSILGKRFKRALSGKEKSELTESRFRQFLKEDRPKTTDYDFCSGEGYFFESCRVELKQFDVLKKSPKLQQVKPYCYDLIIVGAEYKNKTEWWLLETNKISSSAGKEHQELGKLPLNRQHKGNQKEGQISYSDRFKKTAIKVCDTGPINYSENDLGLSDQEISKILHFTKNHKTCIL
jgi:hypothetical protein